jgi:hypothetical protein
MSANMAISELRVPQGFAKVSSVENTIAIAE